MKDVWVDREAGDSEEGKERGREGGILSTYPEVEKSVISTSQNAWVQILTPLLPPCLSLVSYFISCVLVFSSVQWDPTHP